MFRLLAAALIAIVMTFPAEGIAQPLQTGSESKVRTYYVAADEVEWDYAPGGVNKMMGMKFEGNSKVFTERGPHRIGTVYRKARLPRIHRCDLHQAQAARSRMGTRRHSRSHFARRSRRHHPCRLQEQRHASLQYASAWSLLRQEFRRRLV